MKNVFENVFAVAALTALLVCGAPGARAAEGANEKSAQPTKPEHKPKSIPFHGKVTALDTTAKVITLEGKEKSRTFQITSETRITKDGKPAVLKDVTVAGSVSGRAKENAAGKWEVVTLNVGANSGTAKQNEKKPEKK